jgi:hypothetical protein
LQFQEGKKRGRRHHYRQLQTFKQIIVSSHLAQSLRPLCFLKHTRSAQLPQGALQRKIEKKQSKLSEFQRACEANIYQTTQPQHTKKRQVRLLEALSSLVPIVTHHG